MTKWIGLIWCTILTITIAASVGDIPEPSTEPYGWGVVFKGAFVFYGLFALGYFGGREDC